MTESNDIFYEISTYYDNLVRRYGHDPRACDYGRPESQMVKFRVLAEVMDLSEKTILDVGCGFADLADYLNNRYKRVSYTGVDLSPEMIREAKALHPDLDLRQFNILNDEIGNFDVVTANGVFYLLGEDAPELTRRLISRMFGIAHKVVAFNSLSSWAPSQETGEYYADPLELLDFCRSLSSRVVLRHDYHRRDFTIYLYKQPDK